MKSGDPGRSEILKFSMNESYYEIFVKYFWRRDEFRSYISRRPSIMLQNGFVRAGVSPIFKSG